MDDLHIYLYGEFGWDITAGSVQEQLSSVKDYNTIIMHVSSPGGGVFEGWTVGNIIKGTGKKVVAVVEGLCASIATYPVLIADEVQMAETARFMIHNPTTFTEGEEKDLEGAVEMLKKIKADLIKTYSKKTGLGDDELSIMMDNETWFNAEEALSKGFVDSIVETPRVAAKFDLTKDKIMKPEEPKKEISTSKLEAILDRAENALKGLFKVVPKNMVVELEGGMKIFVESEDGEFVGKKAYTVDEEGNPTETFAPAGTHSLIDGRTITIDEEGTVTAVGEAQDIVDEEEMNILKTRNQELETELQSLKDQHEAAKSENEELRGSIVETQNVVSQLVAEVNNFKEMTVGQTFKVQKPIASPTNKFEQKKEVKTSLGSWGASIANQVGIDA